MNIALMQGLVPQLNIASTQLDALGFTGDKLIIGGGWLTGFGITESRQLKITAEPGVMRLHMR